MNVLAERLMLLKKEEQRILDEKPAPAPAAQRPAAPPGFDKPPPGFGPKPPPGFENAVQVICLS